MWRLVIGNTPDENSSTKEAEAEMFKFAPELRTDSNTRAIPERWKFPCLETSRKVAKISVLSAKSATQIEGISKPTCEQTLCCKCGFQIFQMTAIFQRVSLSRVVTVTTATALYIFETCSYICDFQIQRIDSPKRNKSGKRRVRPHSATDFRRAPVCEP